ncbi:NAD-dependent DNA ligase LigA [Patescibacteria group bacterium]|nr:NAD-dependent DNA ligase LigA [Patescibacteria group bacterium]
MTRQEAKKRIEKLKKLINHHRYLYHVLDKQEISDAALDSLKKELFDLEQKFPEFITLDSPTQRVGGKPLAKFEKVRHLKPMLSFNDAFSQKDIENWLARILKLLTSKDRSQIDFYCELKIDGLAIEMVYNNGILETGSTRGNGLIGEDISQNLKTIGAIPLKLREKEEIIKDFKKEKFFPEIADYFENKIIVARGEVFISQKDFKRINQEREKQGLAKYANPRNIAAGSVRQLDTKITAKRKLDSFAYDLITGFDLETHEQEHRVLKVLGFKTNPHNKFCKDLKEVFEFHKLWQNQREKLDYEIDGVVVQVNNNKIFEKLGVVGKAPRGAVAFKFPLKQAATIVEDIKIQIGRTGALTPVAYLKPIKVGGVTISRATLHNEDEIERLGVKIGDTVIIGRAGDVIPDIIKVLPELRTGKEKEFKMPERCPVCGSATIRSKGEVLWRCSNSDCFAKQKKYFHHFISRGAFDIAGVGPKIVDRLIAEGLISDPADLFELKEGDLILLERFADKSAQNSIKAIQSKKKISLPRFIYALGIRNVGEETAQDLAEYFGSVENLKKISIEGLERIRDVGPVVAKSIYKWFHQKRNLEFLEKLKVSGVKIENPSTHQLLDKHLELKGKIFVLTGGLGALTRGEIKEKIRLLGGDISESVSKNIDYVVAGKEPGAKYERAKELGVKIINEKQFLKLISE